MNDKDPFDKLSPADKEHIHAVENLAYIVHQSIQNNKPATVSHQDVVIILLGLVSSMITASPNDVKTKMEMLDWCVTSLKRGTMQTMALLEDMNDGKSDL
jgi:hypothetical protein